MPLPQLLQQTAFSVPAVAAVSTGAPPLGIDVPHQEQDNWCWCAVTVGVSRFFDPTFSLRQCETAARILSIGDACIRPGDDDVNRLFELDRALGTFGHFDHVVQQPLTFDQVESEIQSKRPVGVQILFQDSGLMHFTVIRGCRKVDGDRFLLIDDPRHDESECGYEEFRDVYRGDGVWKRSYITR